MCLTVADARALASWVHQMSELRAAVAACSYVAVTKEVP